ncbi:fimbrial biogenesis usher protein [Serratia ureilytica]|nr:fimbrial biogenesis usher protein [Serratia ureilytica]MBU5412438.1 fimbrial biogenesis usher protein [Serratia ureilytica]
MWPEHLKACSSRGGSIVVGRNSILGLCMVWVINTHAHAEEFFNPSFLSDNPAAVADLSRFEKGEGQAQGSYRVEIYLNDEYIATQDIMFNTRQSEGEYQDKKQVDNYIDDSGLEACLTRATLERLNVNTQRFMLLKEMSLAQCVNIARDIPQASTRFDFESQRLYISIPQAALLNNARGYIHPEEWDDGVSAFLLNYNFTGSRTRNDYSRERSANYFLILNNGFNFNSWRLRNYSTWSYGSDGESGNNRWQNVNTYIQRTILPLKAMLKLGDGYSLSEIFNSVGFRGAQLASDDNMLPDSLRGFAPTVRGIANSNAKVTVKQNGNVIYQTYVPPGAFEITDLYSTSSSGDLQVIVMETNGGESGFTVPYSTVPVLQREGRIRYALSVGEYRSNNLYQDKPAFWQGTLMWGLPAGVTLYGGSQFAKNYSAIAMGGGINMGGWGAVSADVTQANSILADGSKHQGQSLRFLYAKSLNAFGTNLQLLGYRYSTQGFYTLDETSYRRMSGYTSDIKNGTEEVKAEQKYRDYYNLNYARKGRVQVNITQQLGSSGSAFLTGSQQTYWHTDRTNELWQLGYSAFWRDITYSLSYNYNKSPGFNGIDKRIALNVSLPLGKWLSSGGKGADITSSNNTVYATYAANTDMSGRMAQQTGVSGTLLDGSNLSYSIQQGNGNRGVSGSGSANLNYQGGSGSSNIGYNYSKGYRQVNYGLSGGVVAHANGVTLSQPLGDTNVLVKAPGVSGVELENATGVSTDWRGFAVVPYATTYRRNRIALDTTTLKNNADLDNAVVNVVPTLGALVRAEFTPRIGVRALVTLMQRNGRPVPFGATVDREDGKGGSIVGDNGQVYLSGLSLNGQLVVKWGNGVNQACRVNYSLPKDSENKAISYAVVGCQ